VQRVPARLWKPSKRGGGAVLCLLCRRVCGIPYGGRGFCLVRVNEGGSLYTLNYGYNRAIGLDPVEKKPLYHFMPGTMTFSIGAPGCNFDCSGCQNFSLSRPEGCPDGPDPGSSPKDLVKEAVSLGSKSISFTYSEPTVFFEYAWDVSVLAQEGGLPRIWVTNGFFSMRALDALASRGLVSAMNIDLKGFTEDFYRTVTGGRLRPVLESIAAVREAGIWLEVTTLLIPGLNDSERDLRGLCDFLAGVGLDIPWHVSRFMPLRRQAHLRATSRDDLLRARAIGREAGLRHVYIGNMAGPGFADTVCPSCGGTAVSREGYSVPINVLGPDGSCPKCGARIPGVWS
jgi:pyruvate formate lyase activating enzyme